MPRKTNLTVLNMELGVQLSGVKTRYRDNGKVTASLIILDKSTLLRFPPTLYLSLVEGQRSEVILTDIRHVRPWGI